MFNRSLMVSVGVSTLGTTSIHLVKPGVKVNGQYYRKVLLMQNLSSNNHQSEFKKIVRPPKERDAVDLQTIQTPDFIRHAFANK